MASRLKQILELKKDLETAQTRHGVQERATENLRFLNTKLLQDLTHAQEKYESLQLEHESLVANFSDLEDKKTSLQAKLEEILLSKESADIENAKYSKKIELLAVDLEIFSKKLNEETAVREKAESQLRDTKQELLHMQSNMKNLQITERNLGEVKESMRMLRDQFDESQHQRQVLAAELKISKTEAASSNRAMKESEKKLSVLSQQHTEQGEALSVSRREVVELQKQLDTMEGGIKGNVQLLERERDEALDRLKVMEQRLISVAANAENYRMDMEARWSPWVTWTAVAVTGCLAASIGVVARARA